MRTENRPSHDQSLGELRQMTRRINNKTITIITNHYLKDIREELLEEENKQPTRRHNEIIHIKTKLNGITSTVMIDTGSNISLIDNNELEKIQRGNQVQIPTLPIKQRYNYWSYRKTK